MFARVSPVHQAQGTDEVARAVGALALAALAVIHVVDLPPTLGPTPLVGAGYFAIIAAAVVTGGAQLPVITSSWVIDSTWVTSQRIPALGRRIAMTCSFHLEPEL